MIYPSFDTEGYILLKNKLKLNQMKAILIFGFLLFVTSVCFSQKSENISNKKSTYIYSIDNVTNQQQLDKLISEVEKIKGITDIKAFCKWESGKGQLTFTLTEVVTENEDKENFDMAVIKQIILNQNLGFVDFRIK